MSTQAYLKVAAKVVAKDTTKFLAETALMTVVSPIIAGVQVLGHLNDVDQNFDKLEEIKNGFARAKEFQKLKKARVKKVNEVQEKEQEIETKQHSYK